MWWQPDISKTILRVQKCFLPRGNDHRNRLRCARIASFPSEQAPFFCSEFYRAKLKAQFSGLLQVVQKGNNYIADSPMYDLKIVIGLAKQKPVSVGF